MRHSVFPGAIVVAAVVLSYLNAFAGTFQFDDYNVIVNNAAVHSWKAWLDSMPGIRPLLKLSYTLNWLIDPAPIGFHLFNVMCHIASTFMVFALARRFQATFNVGIASHYFPWIVAAVFALHPAQTEAVTYVSGRSVSLMAVLYLGSMLTYLRGTDRNGRLLSHGLSPLLFVAALAVKETAVTLPFALLLWERARQPGAWREKLARLTPHWVVLVLAAASLLVVDGYRHLLAVSLATRAPWENLLVQADAVTYLLVQPLLLLHVNIDPDLRAAANVDIGLVMKAIALTASVAWAALLSNRRPWLAVALFWFFLHVAPTNSLLARLDLVNDRQLYLASIGFALAASVIIFRFLTPRRALIASAVFAGVLAIATLDRNEDYRSEVALWSATVQDSPHKARAWNNLGYAHHVSGNPGAARQSYERALSVDPGYIRASANLRALKD